ncbi:hypothetical protein BU14_0374s0010 [Porphyra umbilicalis]|uniref:Uncharacterized protein n=1 Tax=Porphyra umbilicalis TaxID=2786 RepID=A0A1X6NXB3_PORUM|nr:hypothetical protein BU14_0374s0010 [Porphyra umbilicalis]|eukprot:OSX73136.1 hypothetical protein BU14_0374s0010 [Porphyra umbilicalis]
MAGVPRARGGSRARDGLGGLDARRPPVLPLQPVQWPRHARQARLWPRGDARIAGHLFQRGRLRARGRALLPRRVGARPPPPQGGDAQGGVGRPAVAAGRGRRRAPHALCAQLWRAVVSARAALLGRRPRGAAGGGRRRLYRLHPRGRGGGNGQGRLTTHRHGRGGRQRRQHVVCRRVARVGGWRRRRQRRRGAGRQPQPPLPLVPPRLYRRRRRRGPPRVDHCTRGAKGGGASRRRGVRPQTYLPKVRLAGQWGLERQAGHPLHAGLRPELPAKRVSDRRGGGGGGGVPAVGGGCFL